MHALDVAVDHAGAQGARAVQGDKSDDLLVGVGLHVLDGGGHTGRLYLEHAGRVPLAEKLVDLGVREVDLVHIDVHAGGAGLDAGLDRIRHAVDVGGVGVRVADVRERLVDDRERAQAQEVHLE